MMNANKTAECKWDHVKQLKILLKGGIKKTLNESHNAYRPSGIWTIFLSLRLRTRTTRGILSMPHKFKEGKISRSLTKHSL